MNDLLAAVRCKTRLRGVDIESVGDGERRSFQSLAGRSHRRLLSLGLWHQSYPSADEERVRTRRRRGLTT